MRVDALGQEAYDRILALDIGDIVGVLGVVYITQRGQLALAVRECTLLTKTLRPPPDKHHGLGDTGTRYRYRELDLIANEETRDLFVKRARIVAAIREWLEQKNFVEVETPALQSLAGGAGSRPFTTHHNALNRDLYLRISVELFLNRCIVGGMENVYDMGKVFRNEGISPKHSPEFTIIEFMMAYADYNDVATATEEMFRVVAQRALGQDRDQAGRRSDRPRKALAAHHDARADHRGGDRRRLHGGRPRAARGGARRAARPGGELGGAGRGHLHQADRADDQPADTRVRLPARAVPDHQAPLRPPRAGASTSTRSSAASSSSAATPS